MLSKLLLNTLQAGKLGKILIPNSLAKYYSYKILSFTCKYVVLFFYLYGL